MPAVYRRRSSLNPSRVAQSEAAVVVSFPGAAEEAQVEAQEEAQVEEPELRNPSAGHLPIEERVAIGESRQHHSSDEGSTID
jgi:hypothetical protein